MTRQTSWNKVPRPPSVAYTNGRHDRRNGKAAADNPHKPRGQFLYMEWLRGWMEEDDEYRNDPEHAADPNA